MTDLIGQASTGVSGKQSSIREFVSDKGPQLTSPGVLGPASGLYITADDAEIKAIELQRQYGGKFYLFYFYFYTL